MPEGEDMASLGAIYILWYREVLRLRRDRVRLVAQLTSPLLFFAVFGLGLSRPMGLLAPGLDFIRFLFPGILGMTVLMAAVMSGMSVVWEREVGFLKEVLVAPVSRSSLVLGKALGGATIALIQGIILLLLAPFLGVGFSFAVLAQLLPLLFLVALALGGLGLLIASRMQSMEGFMAINGMLIMPLIFLSGAFFPVNNLPLGMAILVRVNPVTYGVDAIRQVILGPLSPGLMLLNQPLGIWAEGLVVALFGVITLGLAIWSFSYQE